MISNKLLSLLSTFNKYELNRLRKFLQSPYFNENEQLVILFEILNKFVRSERENINQQAIWKKIAPGKSYNDTRFRRLCSDLNKLAQEFVMVDEFKKLPLASEAILLKDFNNRNLDKHFAAVERNVDNTIQKMDRRDADFHYYNTLIEYEKHLFLEKHGVLRTKKINLDKADFSLNCFYITQKLKNYCDAINYKNIINLDIPIHFIDLLLEELKDSTYLEVPSIAIYYQIMLMLMDRENEEYFHQLKNLLDQHNDKFSKAEMRTMYIFAQNFCIKKLNSGEASYYYTLFDIYKTLIEKEIIFNKGILPPSDYKNITTVGLRIEEYEWAEKFITKYNKYLPKIARKNALAYNLALLNFYKGSYQNVIELLRDVTYKDVFDALHGRWLLLKTYYELDEFDALDALMDSFKIFLRRNKNISKDYQQMYMNSIKFLQKIMRMPYESKANRQKLRAQIESNKRLIERRWILGKYDELAS